VARQTDYSASKHAAVGFDESLRAELRSVAPGVRTTAVCPYYIDTGMFEGVRTRLRSPADPAPDDVTRRIADAIERNRPLLVLPPSSGCCPSCGRCRAGVRRRNGPFRVNASMDHFVGRGAGATGLSDPA